MCSCTSEVRVFDAPGMTKDTTMPRLSLHRAAYAGGECVGQVLAQQLLHKIERIEKRAVYQDASAAQRKELRGLDLHDAVIVALAQNDLLDRCDVGPIDGHEFDLVHAA